MVQLSTTEVPWFHIANPVIPWLLVQMDAGSRARIEGRCHSIELGTDKVEDSKHWLSSDTPRWTESQVVHRVK